MGEIQRPGGGREHQPQPRYIDARRYPTQEEAARAHQEGQQALQEDQNNSDISIYRIQPGPDFASHVVALGDPPSPQLKDKFEIAFGVGERITLAPDIVQLLVERRAQAKQLGPWVEGHYRPGKPVWLDKRRGRY